MLNKQYDALVIGSGAAGSFAAKELTERGLNVLLLEAGRNITKDDFKPVAEPPERSLKLRARLRAALGGQHVQARVAFYGKQMRLFFVNDREHPYSTPAERPFLWIRGKQIGGRLHSFGRVLLRWSDYDFKAASRDGHGVDWPVSYAELAPYYDKVEEFLGLCGTVDDAPSLPGGRYIKPSKLTSFEQRFKEALRARWPARHAVPWRYMPPDSERLPRPLLAAQATGRLTVIADAAVVRITSDPSTGKATGVEYVHRITRERETASAKVVVVCASPVESIRLLLNSTSARHPNGIGNSSGVLGHYFMDQCASMTFGSWPGRSGFEVEDTVAPDPFYGVSGGVFIARYENLDTANGKFKRGFTFQGSMGRQFVRPGEPAKFAIMGFGEMLPYRDNRVTLNPDKKDAWGMPIPHISCGMHENEISMLREQTRAIHEMLGNAGMEVEVTGSFLGVEEQGRGAFPEMNAVSRYIFRKTFRDSLCMGAAIHECGGARMGSNPAEAFLNGYNQSWDVPNLFVTDASSFPSGGSVGTTLTVMALTVRACEHIADEFAAGAFA